MKSREEIERAAEQVLNSLNGLQAIEPNEFLYTRIVSRMQQARQEMAISNHKLMVRLSLCVGLFVCINLISFYFFKRNSGQQQVKTGNAAFAKEYQLNGQDYNNY